MLACCFSQSPEVIACLIDLVAEFLSHRLGEEFAPKEILVFRDAVETVLGHREDRALGHVDQIGMGDVTGQRAKEKWVVRVVLLLPGRDHQRRMQAMQQSLHDVDVVFTERFRQINRFDQAGGSFIW